MRKKNDNKPNEKKLINYLKKIIGKWMNEILDSKYNKGKKKLGERFLSAKYFTESIWDKDNNPFTEIKKYDIWGWTSNDTLTKRIARRKCDINQKQPKSDAPRLQLIKTNDYKFLYDTTVNKDKFGPRNCPYDQIGKDFTNPNNRSHCIYKKGSRIIHDKTFKTEDHTSPQDLSLYHPNKVTNNSGQKFYPVGSVWRGRISNLQPNTNEKLPAGTRLARDSKFATGPIKETILISGDVKNPKRYIPVWNSKIGCPECQPGNDVTIWKPEPPKGYTCLGHVVKEGNESPEKDYIKCIPTKCVTPIYPDEKFGKKVWSSKGLRKNYYKTFTEYNLEKPNSSKNSTPVSLYQSGSFNATEERNNREGINFDDDGGYNLFTSIPSYSMKPIGTAYKIDGKCLYNQKPESLYKKFNDSGFGLTGGTKRDEKYSIFKTYGKPPMGIIRNTSSLYSPNGDPKAYYLEDAGSGIGEGNSYFIRAYNKKENKFSDSIIIKNDEEVMRGVGFKNEPGHLWRINVIRDENGNIKKNKETNEILVTITCHFKFEDNINRYFKQEYDDHGKLYESISQNEVLWYFKSIVGELTPTADLLKGLDKSKLIN